MSGDKARRAQLAGSMIEKMVMGDTQGALVEAAEITNNEITEALTYFTSFVDKLAEAIKTQPGSVQGLDADKALRTIHNMTQLGDYHLANIVFGLAAQRARDINLAEVKVAMKEEKG